MDEYKTVVHQSLTRPQLFLGCDRELFLLLIMLVALIIGPMGIFNGNYLAIPIGIAVWLFGHATLIRMAKNDPFTRKIFIRSLAYREYYPAVSYASDADVKGRR